MELSLIDEAVPLQDDSAPEPTINIERDISADVRVIEDEVICIKKIKSKSLNIIYHISYIIYQYEYISVQLQPLLKMGHIYSICILFFRDKIV